jgi:hypothetical protein
MLKKAITIIVVLFSTTIFSQTEKKNLDFIIEIDAEIAVGTITKLNIVLIDSLNEIKIIDADYYPGNLSMPLDFYNLLISKKTKKVLMKINNSVKGEMINYEFELKKMWLTDYYIIFKIYNLANKKYRNRLDPLDKDKNYTFELESPSYTFYRIKAKKK